MSRERHRHESCYHEFRKLLKLVIFPTRLSGIQATIRRRVLLNYRLPPERVVPLLPLPLRPRLVGGFALAGLCVIHLEHVRPTFVPVGVGVASDNAAHRIAVEWIDTEGITRYGVYIPRRDTDSRLVGFAGARLFPARHSLATFMFREDPDGCLHESAADAAGLLFSISGRTGGRVPPASVFGSPAEASAFFESGADAYSPGADEGYLDGVRLDCRCTSLLPLETSHAYVRELLRMFPVGSLEFDSAFLLRDAASRWWRLPPLRMRSRLRRIFSTVPVQAA
jgi:hypothetical protein